MARKQDEFDGLINCLQLINGLFIEKAVSVRQKKLLILLNQKPRLR